MKKINMIKKTVRAIAVSSALFAHCKGRLALLALVALFSVAALTVDACTAIVAGKKASATGHVLIGHNEDGTGMFMRHAMLPPGDGKAAVFWSEAKKYAGGDQVGACVYNERGVFVVSNNGGVMQEWDGESFSLPDEGPYSALFGKGIGYDLRFRAVERAHTARECVEIMIALVKEHGYNQYSRNFLVADAEEAWILEVLKGRRYVARRVPDDEVVVYPNCLIFNKLRPDDLASENIKSKGPDFDIIGFYQGPRTWKSPYNLYRWKEMYRIAAGVDLEPGVEYPFSVRPAHRVSADDIKRGLRTHYEGRPWEVKKRHPEKNPKIIEPICRNATVQSLVCEMNPNPKETTMHLTVGRPCEVEYGVYRPFGGILPGDTAFGEKAVTRLVNHELPPSEGMPTK